MLASWKATTLLCLAVAPLAQAQIGGTGSIQGVISDPSGAVVAAAQVVAANPTISPYNHYNASDLLNNKLGAGILFSLPQKGQGLNS